MRARTCRSPAALSRAFSTGPDAELCAHLLDCHACQAEWQAFEALRALGRELPYAVPSLAASAAMRERVLAKAVPPAPRSRLSRTALVLGVAAAAGLLFLGGTWLGSSRNRPRPPTAGFRGTVQPLDGASFAQNRVGLDEWVRLTEGAIRVEVARLSPGERFRVISSDGDVEVRGTAFEVRALHDSLRSVWVLHGQVAVSRPGHPGVLLGPGERWQVEAPQRVAELAPPPVAPPPLAEGEKAASTPAVRAPPSAYRPTGRTAAPRLGDMPPPSAAALSLAATTTSLAPRSAPTPAERAFADGWAALRRSDFAAATGAFRRAVVAGAGEPILEDARFWLAVALARDGQRDAAIVALRDFAAQHPRSSRRGAAASILGWQLLQAGRRGEAERPFREAAADRSPEIQKSARAGLAAIAQSPEK